MKIPIKIVSEYWIHYLDLQVFLENTYRMQGFDVLGAAGISHGILAEYQISKDVPAIGNTKQRINNIRQGRRTRDIKLILQTMCLDGHIMPGKYVLDSRKRPDPIEIYRKLLQVHQDPDHPQCSEFRDLHASKFFNQQAATLDQAVRGLLK